MNGIGESAVMDEMLGIHSADDPDFILRNLDYISALRPKEQIIYDKAKDAQLMLQSQVLHGDIYLRLKYNTAKIARAYLPATVEARRARAL
jgi:hypothetical protein